MGEDPRPSRGFRGRQPKAACEAIAAVPAVVFEADELEPLLRALAEARGRKAGDLFMAIRVAVTGRTATPPLFDTLVALGRERVLDRRERRAPRAATVDRPSGMRRRLSRGLALIAIIAAIVLVAAAPALVAPRLWPDATAPEGMSRPVADFGSVLASQLDRPPLTHARFVSAETGPGSLVILLFDLRTYPYLGGAERAYLVSRCQALADLDPWSMGGGTVDRDAETDPELVYLRSDEQPACPVVR